MHTESLVKVRKHLSTLQLLLEIHFKKEPEHTDTLNKAYAKIQDIDLIVQKELDLVHYYKTSGNRRKKEE